MALTINTQPATDSMQLAASPVLIEMSSTNSGQTDFVYKLEVTIWQGLKSARPSTADYTLEKKPNTNISSKAIFNISPLILSELSHRVPSNFSNRTEHQGLGQVWVAIDAASEYTNSGSESATGNVFTASEGYGLFENETINDNYSIGATTLLLNRPENTTIFEGESYYVPVNRAHHNEVVVSVTGQSAVTVTLTDNNTHSNYRVTYVDIMDVYSDNSWDADEISYTIRGTGDDVAEQTLKIAEAFKFDVIPVMYLNRFGTLETLFMSKKSIRNNTIAKTQYNIPHMATAHSINAGRRTAGVLNQSTKVQYTLNSDFVSEAENDMFLDLVRSRYVAIKVGGVWRNVHVVTTDFLEKTSLNNRLIQHSIVFEQVHSDENMVI